MRKGTNPNKNKKVHDAFCTHHVVIPVHIPDKEGYYKDGLEIFKLSIRSLLATIHDKTFVTVVDNGSCPEVDKYLRSLYADDYIHEVIHTASIGKINAIFKGLVGHNIPLVTISDADVLFLSNWQNAVYDIFQEFPKTGCVCTTPSPKSHKYLNFNILCDLFASKSLRFKKVKNPDALKNFARSIGNPNFYNALQLDKILTVSSSKSTAVIGAGHFVATYRREVFETLNKSYCDVKLGAGSVPEFLDVPVIKKGLWRLSTYDNFTYHLGNTHENWMDTIEFTHLKTSENRLELVPLKRYSKLKYVLVNKVFAQLFKIEAFYKLFLIKKGLKKSEVDTYLN